MKRARSSITGRFVDKLFARRHPDTAVEESVPEYPDDLAQEIHDAIHDELHAQIGTSDRIEAATREVVAVLVAGGLYR